MREAADRAEGFARAAGAKLAAARIDALFVAAADIVGRPAATTGAKALVRKLLGMGKGVG